MIDDPDRIIADLRRSRSRSRRETEQTKQVFLLFSASPVMKPLRVGKDRRFARPPATQICDVASI
jgi:hypothetical protein